VPQAADPDDERAALGLDEVLVCTAEQAVQGLYRGGAGRPQPPDSAAFDVADVTATVDGAPGASPPAGAARAVREAKAAALRCAPLQSLRALSAREAAARADKGGGGGARKRQKVSVSAPAGGVNGALVVTAEPDEVLLCFALYHHSPKREWLALEVQALGSQTLAQLRDALSGGCPSEAAAQQFGCRTAGAFFLLEGVFYNDTRAEGATDLSAPLREYCQGPQGLALEVVGEGARSHTPGQPLPGSLAAVGGPMAPGKRTHFATSHMASTRLDSLTLRLGASYVYCHQANCEHALRLTDLRRCTAAEVAAAADFPRVTYQLERPRRKCAPCQLALATRVVYNSRLAPESPCLFCDECFQASGPCSLPACPCSALTRGTPRGCTTPQRGTCCSTTSRSINSCRAQHRAELNSSSGRTHHVVIFLLARRPIVSPFPLPRMPIRER